MGSQQHFPKLQIHNLEFPCSIHFPKWLRLHDNVRLQMVSSGTIQAQRRTYERTWMMLLF